MILLLVAFVKMSLPQTPPMGGEKNYYWLVYNVCNIVAKLVEIQHKDNF